VITALGLRVGCVELNLIVMRWGIEPWAVFRVGLMVFMFAIFFVAYGFFLKYYKRFSLFLKVTVILLDLFMGIVVSSGFLAVLYETL
jgi:hypothetical protein